MANPGLLPNMVLVSTTIVIADVTFTTSLSVQTHRIPEIMAALDLAWETTRKEAFRDAASAV